MDSLDEMDDYKKKVLAVLEDSKGNITKACEKLGMPRSTFYVWMNKDSEFKEAVKEIAESTIDFVEDKLMQRIEGIQCVKYTKEDEYVYDVPPDITAIIFYLKTKGKGRGYVEKQEIDHTTKGESLNDVMKKESKFAVRKPTPPNGANTSNP